MPGGVRIAKPRKAGRKWRVQFYIRSTREVSYRVFATEEQAWRCYHASYAYSRQASSKQAQEVAKQYLKSQESFLKPITIRVKEYKLKCVLPDMPVAQASVRAIQDMVDKLTQTNSPNTVKSCVAELVKFFKWCIQNKYLQKNPAEGIDLTRLGKLRKGKKQLHLAEAQRLAQYCLEHQGKGSVAVLLGLFLGLRAGEVVGLSARDIDLVNRLLYIHVTKTAAGVRTLAIPEVLIGPFSLVMAGLGPTDRVFQHRADWCIRNLHMILKTVGLPIICFHGLRGTHASLAYEAGASSISVAQSLGHTSPVVTTKHYIKPQAIEAVRTSKAAESLITDIDYDPGIDPA